MKIIALYNLKGGVGKTTTAVNLAYLSSLSKNQTVLWDWDPQGAAGWYFGAEQSKKKAIKLISHGESVGSLEITEPYPNLNVIPADLSLRKSDLELASAGAARQLIRKLVAPLSKNTDILIFDCPPTLSPTVEYILSGVDLVLVPMIPSHLSLRAMEQVVEFFDGNSRGPKKIAGFFNQVDSRRRIHKDTLKSARRLPLPVLRNWVPMDSAAERMALRRAPLVSYDHSSKASKSFLKLWREVLRVMKKE